MQGRATRDGGLGAAMLALLLIGCGGAQDTAANQPGNDVGSVLDQASVGGSHAALGISTDSDQELGEDELSRAVVDAVLREGPGRFLQGIITEPVRADGAFIGFRLARFFPGDPRFEDVDLRRGDVVIEVNGVRIERPEHLMEVWHGLAEAEELTVHYLRSGFHRTFTYRIVQASRTEPEPED